MSEEERMSNDPFHEGERHIQDLTGERASAILNGRAVASRIPAAARAFIARQQLAVAATRSAEGDLWATMVTGPAGFSSGSEDLRFLDVQIRDDSSVLKGLPLGEALQVSRPIGILFIDLATRRRLRVNGSIASINNDILRVAVQEAFPNCPKYIQRRSIRSDGTLSPSTAPESGTALTRDLEPWIQRADTVFVASSHPDGRLDASHRGGKPGFVLIRDGALRIPDYPGNSLFNTLGNFALNPKAGLTFVDFESARQLQMTGDVVLDFGIAEDPELTAGTLRWWSFRPRRWIASPWNAPINWAFVDASPFNP
jgi:uncharacterized protein